MPLTRALLLGLLQGATEFLPISSSGHLVLIPYFAGWAPPGLSFTVMVHWGTALAVAGYFWRDWADLLQGLGVAVRDRRLTDPRARLLVALLLGTVPGAVVGWAGEDFFEGLFAHPAAAAAFLLATAGMLFVGERLAHRRRGLETLSWADAVVIGLAQAAAILPGISRSGATIVAGMALGLRREPAARFSFLLATPIIWGAGIFQVLDLAQAGDLAAQYPSLLMGFVAAFLSGLAAIHFLLRYLRRRPLYPFALYCLLLGVAGLTYALL